MKIRLLSARNIVRDSLRRHPVFAVGLTVLGIGLFALTHLAVLFVFGFAEQRDVLPETVYQIFYFLFLFLLAGAVPFVASTLLHSIDYGLLFTAPLPPRTIIAAKLLDATVTNSLQFTVLGVPAIVACATVVGLSWIGWLLILPLIACFVLLPALITALGLLIALAFFGMRRLRTAITVLNAVMATVVCVTIVLEAGHLPLKPGAVGASLEAMQPALAARSPAAHASPSGWFASALLGLAGGGHGHPLQAAGWLALIAVVVSLLFLACTALGERLLSAASVAEENDNGGRIESRVSEREFNLWRRIVGAPVAALIGKDARYLVRDSVLLSQLGMPMILILVPFVLGLQDPSRTLRSEMFPFAVAMIGVILFMQTSILSLSSIGLESRSFWIVMTSPNAGHTLLWAKFVLSTLVSAGIGIGLSALTGLVFRISLETLAIQSALIALSSAGLCGLGVGISAALPRFVYENPAHRVSAWALILGFFTTIAYIFATGLLFGMAYLLADRMDEVESSNLIYGVSVTIYLLMTAFVTFVPMAIGARRIEVYQWEH